MRRENAKSYSVRSPDERSEIRDHPHTAPDIASLIRATSNKLDCFAEPVIGRAFARPVGSQ